MAAELTRQQVLDLAKVFGIDPTAFDWKTLVKLILQALLGMLSQPKPALAAAMGCPPHQEDNVACMVDCARQNIEIAACLMDHAAGCCVVTSPVTPAG